MAKRPTIALCMIVKNEAENLPRLFKSFEGCFDEIHVTDTGSTDDTVAVAKALGATVHHFEWINDFAAARNYSFSHSNSDYNCWLDADDDLSDKDAFIKWRDHAMRFADFWYATYDYASDDNGNPVVSFVRERVIKRDLGASWHYFIHEGIIPPADKPINYQYATPWKVIHKRTLKDIEKDHSRNLSIFDKHKDKLDSRMKFYYGKELFENKQPMEGFAILMDACSAKDLAMHDRLLAIQFAAYAAIECNQLDRAIALAHQGLQLEPKRAEYHVVIGDCYIKQNKLADAIPFYNAAKTCAQSNMSGDKYAGAVFNYRPVYTLHPRVNLVRAYFQLGQFEQAYAEAKECQNLFKDQESAALLLELDKALQSTTISDNITQTEDIIITTPPQGAYPWDSKIYKEKAMGGSETAALEVAKWLRKKTNRPVKIFNPRESVYKDEDGVEFIPVASLLDYTKTQKPYRHIAWRHNIKITNAPTYLWSHDLCTSGVESAHNFDKLLALSEFHKNYMMGLQGIPEDKIIVTRNGIVPERFKDIDTIKKIPGKVIFPSSPDRGLDHCMKIMDHVVKEVPNAELHVFYGIENLHKYGLKDLQDKLQKMMEERPWVKYHGATEQNILARHFMESEVWLYSAVFIESHCVTALESMASRCYPIVRDLGALPNTLAPAISRGMATCLDLEPITTEQQIEWSKHVIDALVNKSWQKMDLSPSLFSWESATQEFINFMEIENL